MNPLRLLFLVLLLVLNSCKNSSNKDEATTLNISFETSGSNFTTLQKNLITKVIVDAEREIRVLLPQLPDSIQVMLEIVDWDLEVVGGITGRTETNTPPYVAIQISDKFSQGITGAVHTNLKHVIFHEFHHLYRGWAIRDNKFEQGIAIAAVNEGLAVVFSEIYTNSKSEADNPPSAIIADSWFKEIQALPKDADYQKWMFQHPDGRSAIGYRTGNFLIRKALTNSGKTILELSEMQPDELIRLAGY